MHNKHCCYIHKVLGGASNIKASQLRSNEFMSTPEVIVQEFATFLIKCFKLQICLYLEHIHIGQ